MNTRDINYKPSKEVKNILTILIPYLLLDYMYFLLYVTYFYILKINYNEPILLIFKFYLSMINIYNLLFFLLPTFYSYKTIKINTIVEKINFTIRHNIVFIFLYTFLNYINLFLKKIVLITLDINIYNANLCATQYISYTYSLKFLINIIFITMLYLIYSALIVLFLEKLITNFLKRYKFLVVNQFLNNFIRN